MGDKPVGKPPEYGVAWAEEVNGWQGTFCATEMELVLDVAACVCERVQGDPESIPDFVVEGKWAG